MLFRNEIATMSASTNDANASIEITLGVFKPQLCMLMSLLSSELMLFILTFLFKRDELHFISARRAWRDEYRGFDQAVSCDGISFRGYFIRF